MKNSKTSLREERLLNLEIVKSVTTCSGLQLEVKTTSLLPGNSSKSILFTSTSLSRTNRKEQRSAKNFSSAMTSSKTFARSLNATSSRATDWCVKLQAIRNSWMLRLLKSLKKELGKRRRRCQIVFLTGSLFSPYTHST